MLNTELENLLSEHPMSFTSEDSGDWNIVYPSGEIREFPAEILSDEIIDAVLNFINQKTELKV